MWKRLQFRELFIIEFRLQWNIHKEEGAITTLLTHFAGLQKPAGKMNEQQNDGLLIW